MQFICDLSNYLFSQFIAFKMVVAKRVKETYLAMLHKMFVYFNSFNSKANALIFQHTLLPARDIYSLTLES